MRRLIGLTLAAVTLLLAPGLAVDADAAVRVGFGDQDPQTFHDQRFRELRIKRARVIVPWNVALRRRDRRRFAAWLEAARSRRVEPLVSFSAATGSRCPRRRCYLPSLRRYRHAFRVFHRRFRSVRVISPWNEANHRSQPTFKRPGQAARYYNVVRKYCRRCTVVAADVIDERNMVRWLRAFKRRAKRPRIWGLHNYRDTNRRRGQRYGGTRRLLRTVRGKVWLTETGGIVKFVLPDGRTLFPRSERRANSSVRRMLRLAKRYRRRVKRLYVYHWRQPAGRNRFDAGVVRASGEPRPAYRTLRRALRGRWFAP
jgi:hypothetical protein